MTRKIIILIAIIILAGGVFFYRQANEILEGGTEIRQACMDSGGTVTVGWCWKSGNSFPNSCLVGVCDCPPGFFNHLFYGRKVELCNCGEGKCFNGERCTSIADEIEDCMPKSDIASRDRCQELLNNIRNFDDCVAAGFSIMKSNPPQCATPDGRTFIQETNSTWEQAISAVNGCEVKKVFQAHSRIVTLTIKDSNKLIAAEPELDDIITAIEAVKYKCGTIPIAME
jgi:hypothetical protein